MLAAGVSGRQGAGLHLHPRKVNMTLYKRKALARQLETEATVKVSAHGMELHKACHSGRGGPEGDMEDKLPRTRGREYHKQARGPQSRETHKRAFTCSVSAKSENLAPHKSLRRNPPGQQ